ncbi:MAG: hypothetical protein F6K65_37400 [Moorea sp. SIO3C2]|nr:hypothetical protein [Moorena sp. SIO3C2]
MTFESGVAPLPIPDSRFPIPDSRFPISDSLFPFLLLYLPKHFPNHILWHLIC